MNNFLKILLLILIVLIGITGLGIYWTFYRTLPDYQATHTLEGLDREVQIHWDNYGVPHIYADTRNDLYYSLGYVHAQDRLWQMTLTQMASEGRLAEFLGEDLVEADLFQRTLGFWKIAQKIEQQLPDSTRRILQSYTDGVNQYVKTHPNQLPLEFALVDMEPIPWTVTHSLALARLIAWELNIAWKNELSLAYLSKHLEPAQFRELMPSNEFTAAKKPSVPASLTSDKMLALLEGDLALRRVLKSEGFSPGSNAWAVSSEKTETGYPLLAGDPHLGLSMPGKWYEVHLNLNGRNLSGATLAGAPILVLGQNDFMGWSLTNVMLDDTDFFLEKVNPNDENQYLVDSLDGQPVYREFEIQRELIKVRNSNDTTLTRRLTKHGPVISEIYPGQQIIGEQVISMKWTALQVSHEVDALLGINWAQSFKEFQRHLPYFKVPGQNIIYADRDGNIAMYSLGGLPVRSGNPVLLREGWKPENDWQGYVPFEEMPRTVNPESGWVANANNPVQLREAERYISIYWEPDARYERIRQYLTQNERLSPQIFQAMQLDTYSIYAQQITNMILPVLQNADQDFDTVISYLENWDFQYEPNETAASILDVFMLRLNENVFKDEMGEAGYNNYIRFSGLPARILFRSLRQNSSFFDNVNTDTIETREDLIVNTMRETTDYLESELGEEPYEWRWENIHTVTLKPQLFGQAAEQPDANSALKLIVRNLMNKGPYAARGHKMSINKGSYLWSDPYEMVVGPSIRRVVDLSNMSRTLSITPTGQSGLMLSEYYGDQTESWLNGQYKYLYQDSTLFEETVYRTMRLLPAEAP
ncbi:penicillin acylase family protein [Halalkalibaculum sp. DA3122]|uniref:penicillin acylase family protein n=1 Tax=unclassified Halalkalibaculum TaxID=2964617 RepID=UPI003754224B